MIYEKKASEVFELRLKEVKEVERLNVEKKKSAFLMLLHIKRME